MSRQLSPATGLPYGVLRVCRSWGFPRSSFYAARQSEEVERPASARPGPRPELNDEELLARIRADLAVSPFQGEGHRKVWARLSRNGVRVGRRRVLRLMREHALLSPHRTPKGDERVHDGRITTDEPNRMWGTDGTRVLTVEDGLCWIFTAVEHWNAECVGWHACKVGDRYAALQPVAQGVEAHFSGLGRDAARGLALRMDHGPQYTSDHFVNQLRFWGITPSFALVREPETNGVAERFFRTLKEQVVFGRVFRNLEELRAAVGDFVSRYNQHWLVEKLGFLTPAEARRRRYDRANDDSAPRLLAAA